MPEVVGAVVPPAQVARGKGPLLLEPRQQPAGLLEVSGVGDVLKLVEGTGEPVGRDERKASPGEQQEACDQDCAMHGLWCMDTLKCKHIQILGANGGFKVLFRFRKLTDSYIRLLDFGVWLDYGAHFSVMIGDF